ncbi:MAG: YceI family protein [Desulforhopalus sp.]
MYKMKWITVLLVAFFIGGQDVTAMARSWELDKAHSNFYFSVDHIFSTVIGQFNEFSGEIEFDPAKPEDSKMHFEIEVESVDTNIPKRDKHLQSSDFFDSGKYPLITFSSTSVKSVGDKLYEVTGKFEIKGQVYELVLPLTLAGVKPHPAVKGKDVIGFNGKMTIDRLAYNVGTGKFVEMGVVGKDVEIFVTIEALSDRP